MAYRWDPWRGCHRFSEGCLHCYIHKGDERRGRNTDDVCRAENFAAPLERKKNGEYRMESGKVWLCFASDFLIEDADGWRGECFEIIRRRPELNFHFLTKRIERLPQCLPPDWGDGYDNVTIGCTVENAAACAARLPVLSDIPVKHRQIVCQPLLEAVDIEPWLDCAELVVCGGESDCNARPFDIEWARSLRRQCEKHGVPFEYRQCGTNYILDGEHIRVNPFRLTQKAREAGLSYCPPSEQ